MNKSGPAQKGRENPRSASGKPGPGKARQGRPQQGKAMQGKPGQDRPQKDRLQQGKPGQGRPQQDKAMQGKPGQGRPGQGKAIQGKPGQDRPQQGKPGQGRPGLGKGQAKGRTPKKPVEQIRLNKYIAASGICSRREADQLIQAGLVQVNGKVVSEMGFKINPGDEVRYHGERIRNERKIYLLLNKPKDYVTTTDDPKERKTVMQLVGNACKERIYPVGRLDRHTTGVLLFTNDGDLAKKLTHPSHNKKKVYHVFLDKAFRQADMQRLGQGLELEDGFIQPDALSYVQNDNKREIGLEIHSGRNRIVRRMFEHLGYRVVKLDRVYFAGLTKKNLSRGKWRFLTEREISRLKMNAYE